ncbi:membrane-associated protein, putative, partial [Bodo saltans]
MTRAVSLFIFTTLLLLNVISYCVVAAVDSDPPTVTGPPSSMSVAIQLDAPSTISVAESFNVIATINMTNSSTSSDAEHFAWGCAVTAGSPTLCPDASTITAASLRFPGNTSGTSGAVDVTFYFWTGNLSIGSALASGQFASDSATIQFTIPTPAPTTPVPGAVPTVTLIAPASISLGEAFNVTASVVPASSTMVYDWECGVIPPSSASLCPTIADHFATWLPYPANPTATPGTVSVVLYYAFGYATVGDAIKDNFNYYIASVNIVLTELVLVTPAPSNNSCLYVCPDMLCAADLGSCACSVSAVLGNVFLAFSGTTNGAPRDMPLTMTANATYRVPSGACSGFDLGPYVVFTWYVSASVGYVAFHATSTGSGSPVTIPANTIASNGTYFMTVSAAAPFNPALSSFASASIVFGTPAPQVNVTGPSNVDASESFTVTATVSFLSNVYGFVWRCSSLDIVAPSLCPETFNGTFGNVTFPANPRAQAGRVSVSYYYMWDVTTLTEAFTTGTYVEGTLSVAFTSANPSLKIVNSIANQVLDYNTFFSSQKIALWSITNYSAAYTRVWTINGEVLNTTLDNFTIPASLNLLRSIPMSQFQIMRLNNIIRVTVTDRSNSTLTSYAEVDVTVLELFPATLTIANANSVDSSAMALSDTIILNYSVPLLNNSYYWFYNFAVTFVYYTTSATGVEMAMPLPTKVNGTTVTATAPQLPDTSVTSLTMKFGLVVTMSYYPNVSAGTANATFNITRNDACLYQCPDQTCASSLATCACVAADASISVPTVPTFDSGASSLVRMLEVFNVSADATYGVFRGNCSGLDLTQFVNYTWHIKDIFGATKEVGGHGDRLVLPPNSFVVPGEYTLTVTATGLTNPNTGLFPSATASNGFTVSADWPAVNLVAPVSAEVTDAFNVTATVSYLLTTGQFTWVCAASRATLCPSANLSSAASSNTTTFVFPGLNPGIVGGTVTITIFFWFVATTFEAARAVGDISSVSATILLTSRQCVGISQQNGSAVLFDNVPLTCVQPFDCFAEFCLCVNGTVSATCTPFGANVNASVIEMCTARRVSCIISAALNTGSVWDATCQRWGEDVNQLYTSYYYDRSSTNLTDLCLAESCSLVTAGSSDLAGTVNYSRICDINVLEIGAPRDSDVVVGCVAPARTHFDVPAQCGAAANCSQSSCVCLGGSWTTSLQECLLPAAQPLDSVLDACLASYVSCVTVVALDVYIPGASPLNTDPCQRWAVPIAEDYAFFYYNATRLPSVFFLCVAAEHGPVSTMGGSNCRRLRVVLQRYAPPLKQNNTTPVLPESTSLWQACNYTACTDIYRFNHSAHFSSACTFAAVNRTPTFVAYNACPYLCPDSTCAADLASCACTANAAVANLSTSANYDLANILPTTQLQITASASYAVASGNCSDFAFGSSLKFTWSVTNASGVVLLSYNGSRLTVASNTLTAGSYTATVAATGLLGTQQLTLALPLTVVVLQPTVQISGPTLATSLRSFALTAVITNPATSSSFNWTCTSLTANVSCPNLSNGTSSSLFIAAGAPSGTFSIVYQYFSNAHIANATVLLEITSDDIPVVTVRQALTGSIAASSFGINAFAYTQQISASGTVQFSSAYTRSWRVNGVRVNGALDSVVVAASLMKTTTFANAKAGVYVYNTITLTATSNSNSNVIGNASVTVVVLESVASNLTILKSGSASATFAQGLVDTLVFAVNSTPSVTTTSVPLGATLQTSVVYYTVTNNVESVGMSLLTTTSGATQVGAAPLVPNGTAHGTMIKFGIQISLSGVVVSRANSTFNITLADAAAAATSVLASAGSITDPDEAVQALGNMGALLNSFSSSS